MKRKRGEKSLPVGEIAPVPVKFGENLYEGPFAVGLLQRLTGRGEKAKTEESAKAAELFEQIRSWYQENQGSITSESDLYTAHISGSAKFEVDGFEQIIRIIRLFLTRLEDSESFFPNWIFLKDDKYQADHTIFHDVGMDTDIFTLPLFAASDTGPEITLEIRFGKNAGLIRLIVADNSNGDFKRIKQEQEDLKFWEEAHSFYRDNFSLGALSRIITKIYTECVDYDYLGDLIGWLGFSAEEIGQGAGTDRRIVKTEVAGRLFIILNEEGIATSEEGDCIYYYLLDGKVRLSFKKIMNTRREIHYYLLGVSVSVVELQKIHEKNKQEVVGVFQEALGLDFKLREFLANLGGSEFAIQADDGSEEIKNKFKRALIELYMRKSTADDAREIRRRLIDFIFEELGGSNNLLSKNIISKILGQYIWERYDIEAHIAAL